MHKNLQKGFGLINFAYASAYTESVQTKKLFLRYVLALPVDTVFVVKSDLRHVVAGRIVGV